MPGSRTLPHPSSLEVRYRGNRLIGTLAQTPEGLLAFQYDSEWLRDGFSISPLSLPLDTRVFVAPRRPLDGVFGVFADSLPDGWGRLLVDRALRERGIDPSTIGPLARLAIVGEGGMGALTYHPTSRLRAAWDADGVELDALALDCAAVLKEQQVGNLDALFELGGSSGGARPKALLEIDGESWIVKFPSSGDGSGIGEVEYRYSCAARACDIDMPETRLFPSRNCAGYFGVKRFDRSRDSSGNVVKAHMASAAGLLETSHRIPNLDYRQLMQLVVRLTGSFEEIERLYRLMCFNVFAGNRDDHSKNFSFLYLEEAGGWSLSPAYDLTLSAGMNGEHATTVNGKGRDIGIDDLMAVGTTAGLSASASRAIAENVRDVVHDLLGR